MTRARRRIAAIASVAALALLLGPRAPAADGAGPALRPADSRAGEPDWSRVADETARLLSGYIRIDTSNPPGNELPGAEHLARFFAEHGIDSRVLAPTPARGSVVARLPATHPDPAGRGPILLLSHIDVVPVEPDAWSFPPFSGAIEDGFVYGRGALDDKGHGAAQAMALVLLARSGLPRTRDVIVCAAAGEETGDDDARAVGVEWLLREHGDALGPPAVVWNEGGWSTPSALVGDRVVNAVATAEKRALWLTLHVEGQGGHGSRPRRDGANQALVRALERLLAYETPLRVHPTVAETFARLGSQVAFPLGAVMQYVSNPVVLRLAGSQLTASPTTNAMVRDTIALTGLRSGVKHNVIPRHAEAMLDVRLLPDSDAAAFLETLALVLADDRIEIRDAPQPLPPVAEASPTDHELFRAIEDAMGEELPESTTAPLLTTGGTDSKWFRERGIPAYGFFPVQIDEKLLDTVHGLDERVAVSELGRAVRVTYRALVSLVR